VGSTSAVGETFLPRIEYDFCPGSAASGLPTVVLDLTDESNGAGGPSC
jgi:hypothetical protein